jgi:hypothetical protein
VDDEAAVVVALEEPGRAEEAGFGAALEAGVAPGVAASTQVLIEYGEREAATGSRAAAPWGVEQARKPAWVPSGSPRTANALSVKRGPGDRARGGQTDRSYPQARVAAISVFIASMKGRPD